MKNKRTSHASAAVVLSLLLVFGLWPASLAFAVDLPLETINEPDVVAPDDPLNTDGSAPGDVSDAVAKDLELPDGEGDAAVVAPSNDPEVEALPLVIDDSLVAAVSVNIPSGLYNVQTALSGSASLDISNASTSSGANVQIWSENSTPAQRFYFHSEADGYYTISNLNSGMVLDVSNASNRAGTNVQQWSANGSDAQKWKIVEDGNAGYVLVSKLVAADGSALVLDITGANSSNGTNVQIFTANSSLAQSWHLTSIQAAAPDGVYQLVTGISPSSTLDIYGASYVSGGNAQIWTTNGTAAQKFQLTYDSSTGYYEVRNANSGLVLDVSGGGTSDGSNVQQWISNGTLAQKWTVLLNSDGMYTLRSAASGLALDVSGGSAASGANVQVWTPNNTAAQRWDLVSTTLVSEGLYTIACSANTNMVLDVSHASQAQGGNIQIWASNDSWAQKFTVQEFNSSGYYTIRNLNSGMLVGVAGGSSSVGANVDQGYDAGPSDTQLWRPTLVDGGLTWVSKNGLTLDVAGGSIANGTNVQVWEHNGSAAQKFTLVSTGVVVPEGVYEIESALLPGAVVDIPSASTSNGATTQLWESNGTAAQRFYISSTGDGYYRITSLCSNKSLDVKDFAINSSDGSGVVQQWSISDNDAQRWHIDVTSQGYFALYSKCGNGGSCLTVANSDAKNGASVGVLAGKELLSQQFILKAASSSVSYLTMNMTLAQQAGYQLTQYHTYQEYYDALNPDNVSTLTTFADLRGYSGLSTSQLDGYIASTANGRRGTLSGMGWAFVEAAKMYGLNEAYVLSHAVLESAWGTSELASGYNYSGGWIDGVYYPAGTYYNYYGIGAYDDSPLSGGRKLAIINGWTSPEKAIKGGAKWISESYTYANYPQYTLYNMRFDTLRSNATLARGWHQYATSLTWMNSIAKLMDTCYSSAGVSASYSYVIPRYR